jgi:hypothetical protein
MLYLAILSFFQRDIQPTTPTDTRALSLRVLRRERGRRVAASSVTNELV